MPDVQLAIRNATVEDTDAWNLTQLARYARMPAIWR